MLALLAAAAAFAAQSPDALWREGRRAEAIEAGAAALARKPGDEELRLQVARWEMAVHRYAAALERLAPLGRDCDPLRGEALYHLAEYARAVPRLSDRDPAQVLMLVDALEALGRFAESDAALEKARERLGKDDPRVLGCEGRRLARERRFPEAAAAFRAALAADPWDGEALYGLGRALVAAGGKEEGLKALARHRELVPLLDRVDFARRGVDLAPAHAPNWTALGDAERALGRLDRAEQDYLAADRLATPEHLVPNALRHARLLAEDRRDPSAAIALLAKASVSAPDARLWVRIGDLHRDAGRRAEAIEAYGKALALRPQDAEIRKRLEEARAK